MVPVFDVNGAETTTKSLERSVGVSLGFVNEFVNVSVKPETDPTLTARKLEASLVFQAPHNLFWGFKAKYDPVAPAAEAEKTPEKSNWDLDFRLHYALPDSSFTLAYEPDPNEKKKHPESRLQFSWFQNLSPSLKAATSILIPEGTAAPVVTLACEKKVDDVTTVKSKLVVGEDSRAGFAYTQKVSPYATASIGADLNALKLLGETGGKDHFFGFELQLK